MAWQNRGRLPARAEGVLLPPLSRLNALFFGSFRWAVAHGYMLAPHSRLRGTPCDSWLGIRIVTVTPPRRICPELVGVHRIVLGNDKD